VMLEIARAGARHGLRTAPDSALLGKTLLNVNEIGRVLDPRLDVNAMMREQAAALMRRRFRRLVRPSSVWPAVVEAREFAERLPAADQRACAAARSAGAMSISSACAVTCALTSSSAFPTAPASPARNTEFASIRSFWLAGVDSGLS